MRGEFCSQKSEVRTQKSPFLPSFEDKSDSAVNGGRPGGGDLMQTTAGGRGSIEHPLPPPFCPPKVEDNFGGTSEDGRIKCK